MKDRILIVDDDLQYLRLVSTLLNDKFDVECAINSQECLNKIETSFYSAILVDLKLPKVSGFQLIKKIREEFDQLIPIIVVSEQNDVQSVLKCMKSGANDFVPKVFDLDELVLKIDRALEIRRADLRKQAIEREYHFFENFIHNSETGSKIYSDIIKHSKHDHTLLLLGETGTGKDIIAYQIHKNSIRKNNIFRSINLQTLSESLLESELFGYAEGAFTGAGKSRTGLLEICNGGTLHISEFSSISPALQIKLLEFMQFRTIRKVGEDARVKPRRVDVRIILSTLEDPEKLSSNGNFREDLISRIKVNTMIVPPLRDRLEDIEKLAPYFLRLHGLEDGRDRLTFSKDVIPFLKSLQWNRNVRELENAIISAMVEAFDNPDPDVIQVENFSPFFSNSRNEEKLRIQFHGELPPFEDAKKLFEQSYFSELIKICDGNKTKAALLAGMSKQNFHFHSSKG
ncbi:MAG: sigma-54 dependent transcriptional regulator [Bacteroidetes bacterium]|nr:sigma-54 dependent transcriptional regulator [Bacteroidota bacterium]